MFFSRVFVDPRCIRRVVVVAMRFLSTVALSWVGSFRVACTSCLLEMADESEAVPVGRG